MSYATIKALHLIFVISWFAALFYMIRLFIYHTETKTKEEPAKSILADQYKLMQRRLWYIIGTPAMILTILFGTLMVIQNPILIKTGWFHIKLGFIIVLLIYHFVSHKIFSDLQKDKIKWSSTGLRIWNEVATLLMVIIVFVVVLKSSMDWIYGVIGFFGVALLLMAGIKIYKALRNKQ